ncbi:acyl-CoA dehydrogenase [Mycobacterium sp. E796]|nr:acyl-CoA dehydrogenase [Mycobacterium sp. E796]
MAITEDHRDLAEVASALVSGRGGIASARRILLDPHVPDRWWSTDPLWKEIVSTGWLGMHIDEKYGGQGYRLPELAIVLEQLGRAALGGPFLPTAAASSVIAQFGTDEQRERWLPGLVSGDVVAGITFAGDSIAIASRMSVDAVPALAEPGADLYLVWAGPDVLIVPAGDSVEARRTDSIDQLMRPIAAIAMSSAPIADTLVGAASPAMKILRLLVAAEAAGGLAACTEMATAYAATREQFGRPIGSFQAIKHHCANMLFDTELATGVVWDAARATGREADLAAAMAAGHALPAYQRVSLKTVQILGGIGYTWEHDAHLYVRRATVLNAFFGDQSVLRDAVYDMQREGLRRRNSVDLPPEAAQYRQSAEQFRADLATTKDQDRQKFWARSGYLQPHWPKPYGRAADSAEQLVIEEVLAGLDKPSLGLGEWVVPTLLQHGTPEQIERLMWPSLEGDVRWCQLFSEPGAGSDAAAVTTRAKRVDGGWLVTGQKVWTSDAMNCQRGLATVRTDPDAAKHKGITAMIIDLAAPGVTIRPLTEITGETLFNEVFFDDVLVTDRDVVGAVNAGWAVAMATLANERVSIGGGSVTMEAESLLDLMRRHGGNDRGLAREVGALLVEAYGIAALNMRQAARAVFESGPGVEGNIVKIVGAEHAQRVAELALSIARPALLTGEAPEVTHDYLFSRCLTIAGGTSEIIRNLVAERLLGLPREPSTR